VQEVKIKPAREVDIEARTHFWRIFIKLFASLAIPFCLVLGIKAGLVADAIISLVLTVIAVLFLDRISSIPGALFGNRQPIISLREQMQGTLKAVKVVKMNKDYKKALDMVNGIIEKDSGFYEARLVKAQILCEGYANIDGAKKYLNTILENTDESASVHSWALSYLEQISKPPKVQQKDSPGTQAHDRINGSV